jgi:hypothetical protein
MDDKKTRELFLHLRASFLVPDHDIFIPFTSDLFNDALSSYFMVSRDGMVNE